MKKSWFLITEMQTLTNVQTNKTTQVERFRVSSEAGPVADVFNSKANANLIIAAPEMLEALEAVAVMLNAHKDSDYQFMLNLIKPAIIKANGGAE